MFTHNLKYSLKTLFKNKMLIFWTYLFPIILGSFFYLAFHDIENKESFNAINIAVVNTSEFQSDDVWQETIKNLSDENSDNQIFKTEYLSLEEAKSKLASDSIVGYFVLENNKPQVIIKQNGTSETIFKNVIEEINSSKKMIESFIETKVSNTIKENPQVLNNIDSIQKKAYEEALTLLEFKPNLKDTTSNNISYTMIEYYTLIAMTCLYGGILGMVAINKTLANMSENGKRVSISPTPKRVLVTSSALAAYIAQVIGVSILFIYTIFVLKVDYGSSFLLVILLALIGSFAGLMLGIWTSCFFKTNENTKLGIMISLTMLGCFLSGMMGITMKYIIDKNIPFLNKINPANMITDGFYSLYYYDTYNRYIFNIISLLVFSGILLILSINKLRREKYDSI